MWLGRGTSDSLLGGGSVDYDGCGSGEGMCVWYDPIGTGFQLE